MKRSYLRFILFVVTTCLILAACSGSANNSNNSGSTNTQPTTATIEFGTTVTGAIPANTIITGYDLTFRLPAGVTVKSAVPPTTDNGVVTATGSASGSLITAVYSPATGAEPGTVRIILANADGINVGEFSTVICDIAGGYSPAPADFNQDGLSLAVSGYDTATDSTVDMTGELALSANILIE